MTLQMLNNMLLTVLSLGTIATQRNMPYKLSLCCVRRRTMTQCVYVNAAVEINVLHYNVAVRRRT